ncbi:uncharacterized protein LOC101238613 [Trichonephila clavipes]|nr:uncharacterized protein LOC101238613 [Trichonephila clavipes]
MEVVGAYRIFERSNVRDVQYNEYYGDGDSKGYESVKNFYGINTVTKLECIGHVQKRNYYGIAIRSNVGNLQKMMSSVIAAFFHCVSGKNNSLHGQCPEGSESWCRYQRAKAAGSPLKEIDGRGSRVVWVSDRGLLCHGFEPSTIKDPPCRAAMHVKSVES